MVVLLRQQLEEEEDSLGLNLDGKEGKEEANEQEEEDDDDEEEEEDRPRQKYEAGCDNTKKPKKGPFTWFSWC